MTTVRVYRSSDTGAPQLNGLAGSLVSVLDAVLVGTGGIAYGLTPSAGWTTAFTGTNARDYRPAVGSNQYFLDVVDTAPQVTALGREARMLGYENMTALGVGTLPFPTVAQGSYLIVRKSTTTDAVIRPWIIIADNRTFYLFTLTGDVVSTYSCFMFGEYYSFKTAINDLGRTMIMGRFTENTASMTAAAEESDYTTHVGTTLSGHFMARNVLGEPGSATTAKLGDWELTNNGTAAAIGTVGFTNAADHLVHLSPYRVSNTLPVFNVRGRYRGMWFFGHPIAAVSDGDVFSGSGELIGKTFLIIKQGGSGGVFCMETSSTWDTNN